MIFLEKEKFLFNKLKLQNNPKICQPITTNDSNACFIINLYVVQNLWPYSCLVLFIFRKIGNLSWKKIKISEKETVLRHFCFSWIEYGVIFGRWVSQLRFHMTSCADYIIYMWLDNNIGVVNDIKLSMMRCETKVHEHERKRN